jgi:hypothetical protein
MKKFAKSFCVFAAACWMLASLGYFLLASLMPGGDVFGGLFRMPAYHSQHPYQYILVAAVAYRITAAFWARFLGHLSGVKRVVSIIAVMLVSLLAASVPGGLLYGIHDVQAGFVPPLPRLRSDLMWAARTGLTTGWLIIALSVPYNILGAVVGYAVTHFGQRILNRETGANKALHATSEYRRA